VTIVANAISRLGVSFIVFLLAGVIALGVVATAAFEGRIEVEAAWNHTLPGLQPFCRPPSALGGNSFYYVLF
jgi:hypothetical protein